MRNAQRIVLSLACGLALTLQAGASGVPRMTMGEMLSDAKAVVHGVVVDQFSQWEEFDGNKVIFTYSVVRVENADFMRLAPTRDVVVRTVGGIVDGYQQVLIDEASFTLGEEVIVFLGLEDGWAYTSVVGFHQGKYTVSRNAAGRIIGVRQGTGQQLEPAKAEQQPLIPLTRFVNDLRRARNGLAQGDLSDVHPLVKVR